MIGITGCTDTTNTRDAAQTDKGFDQTMAVADSLYNCMQFRDAYKLYLQLLDSKEAEANSDGIFVSHGGVIPGFKRNKNEFILEPYI